jgi:hypothetical protein
MSEYGGINMQLSKSNGKMGNKGAPRPGAAKGQGGGMGGYNAGAVNRAMRDCGSSSPTYFNEGSAPAKAGK